MTKYEAELKEEDEQQYFFWLIRGDIDSMSEDSNYGIVQENTKENSMMLQNIQV